MHNYVRPFLSTSLGHCVGCVPRHVRSFRVICCVPPPENETPYTTALFTRTSHRHSLVVHSSSDLWSINASLPLVNHSINFSKLSVRISEILYPLATRNYFSTSGISHDISTVVPRGGFIQSHAMQYCTVPYSSP